MVQAHFRYRLLVGSAIVAAMLIVAWGCGGGAATTGGVEGYVYQLPDGSSVIINCSRIPPEGYVPVPCDTRVYIDGTPFQTMVLCYAPGRYTIHGILAGTWTLVIVCVDGTELGRFTVVVRAGHITCGGGHSEGGGGF